MLSSAKMPSQPSSLSPLGELWEQCLQWLRSAGVLDPREQFTRLADFAALLRNGVLLCELVLRLKPDSIDRHEILVQYQQSPFTCSKNIGLFLSACRTHFGIDQLFDEDDLYGLQNFGAVLRLLSQLSRTQISRQLGLKPFPEETTLPSGLNNAEEDNNAIYSNLRDEVEQCCQPNDRVVVPPYSRPNHLGIASGSTSTSGDDGVEEEGHGRRAEEEEGQKIYDTICGQAVVPQNQTLPISYAEFKPTTKREYCLKELLDKEINFTNAIQRIVDIFYARLNFYLNAEDMETIFINIRKILHVNISFVAKLEPAVLHALNIGDSRRNTANFCGGAGDPLRMSPPLSVAELFIRFKERFTVYGLYCSQLTKSTSRINELERNDAEFKHIISNLARDEQFRLQTLLILPFQHITKYQLLLNDLAKYTTHDLAEQSALNNAREAMKDVCEYLNEMKRDQEIIEYITTITRSISSLDLRLLDYGRLVAHDYVKIVNQNGGGSAQRYMFVFEKLMMFCKRGKDGVYKKKEHLLLDDIELVENELETNSAAQKYNHTLTRKLTNGLFDNTSLTLTRRGAGIVCKPAAVTAQQPTGPGLGQQVEAVQQHLSVTHMAPSPSQLPLNTFQLVFKSLKQRNEWKDVLRKTIETCNPRAANTKGHTLFYKTYTNVTICAICKMLLRGQFFQGYHCSGCNRDMHRECACLRECQLMAAQQNDHLYSDVTTCTTPNGTYQRYKAKPTNNNTRRNCETVVFWQPSLSTIIPTNNCTTGTSSSAHFYTEWRNGDLVELLELNGDGTAIGRLKERPQMVGTISLDACTKISTTLEEEEQQQQRATQRRHSRASSHHSFSDVIPFQSSANQFASPTNGHQSESLPTTPTFVTNAIIDFHKNNPNIAEQPWYFGVMGRAESNQLLVGTLHGTFIVRWSVELKKYALSINVNGFVKHLKLEYEQPKNKYYLHEENLFDTMLELINYYRIHNLNEGFGISVVLRGTPLKGTLYRAVAPFQRTNGKSGYITLRPGDLVTLLDTAQDETGWWRGSVSNGNGETRVGYFPATYVQLVSADQHQSQQHQHQPFAVTQQHQLSTQNSTNNNNNANANNVIVYQNGGFVLQQQHLGNGTGTVHGKNGNIVSIL